MYRRSDFNDFLFAEHLLVVRLHIASSKRDSVSFVWLKRGRLWVSANFVQVHGSTDAGALETEGAEMRIPACYAW